MAIELEPAVRSELVTRLQQYVQDELDMEIGSFDAEFLLDFFVREAGHVYYNQGLTDAAQALEAKVEEFGEVLYGLQQSQQ